MNTPTLLVRRIPLPLRSSRTIRPQRHFTSSAPKCEPVPEKHTPNLNPQPAATVPGPVAASGSVSASRTLIQRIQAGPVGRVAGAYSRVQDRRPYTTQVVSTIIVYLCGDLGAQLLFPPDKTPVSEGQGQGEKDGEKQTGGGGYDPWRTLRHLTVGVGSAIPTYKWFMFLHHNFNYSSKFLSILTKVGVQQACFTPVFNTYFFGLQSLMTGKSLEETFERLKVALPTSISNSVKLWPAVTAFSFMYVAPQFRSIFSGVIAVGWQTYLSWLNQKAAREVEAEKRASVEVGVGVGAGAGAGAVTMKA
ncbi:integral membrane protein, Mpv17/PMP22 family [Aspergillus sclerotiicarbonarius CBS 121057]|uniref:Integral membrane protein, Mpv17/PMP22 family n=1 Tax=Aspergillus sclerotiicarbonarius (strain CBS 121057 / IBT 28362) TaxID=1448318 RepID=A0A319EQA7_ASPSB|nr:integral membrane protein, Mpv17/PMP22 family [Aspergillus sclerotiicarbonarius CBS 121057]